LGYAWLDGKSTSKGKRMSNNDIYPSPAKNAANPFAAPKAAVADVARNDMEGEKLSYMQIWFSFQGRIPRKAYWKMFFIPMLLAGFIVGIFGAALKLGDWTLIVFQLAIIWPAIAAGAKRLHDTDRSGWWQLISIIPVLGLVMLYFFVIRGTEGENKYGGDPTGLY
jgi:uncharacterized membrane protein YhaH (DUF805 family)